MHRIGMGWVCVGLLFATNTFAADAKKCQLQRLGELPVSMSGTRPIIHGTVNGKPAQFLADSGAFFSMMARESAAKFQLDPGSLPPGFRLTGVGGNATKVTYGTANEFSLAGLSGGHVYNDVGFLIGGNSLGEDVDGIIGQNVIGTSDAEYDLANGFIRLFRAKDCQGKSMAYWPSASAVGEIHLNDTTPQNPHLMGTAKINGKKVRVMFDTGAWRSILDLSVAAKVGVKPENDDVIAGGTARGVGKNTTESYLARFDTLDLGGELIKNARLRIAELDLWNGTDMLLGADFFLSHRIYVSTKQNKMYFTYNGGPVFDYRPTYTGPIRTKVEVAKEETPTQQQSNDAQGSDKSESPPSAAAIAEAASLRRRGIAAAGRNDFKSALADLDKSIQLDPTQADSYVERGTVLLRNRQPRLAQSDFEQALKLNPNHVQARMTRGALRLSQKDDAGAREDFDAAINADLSENGTGLRIAQIYSSRGDTQEAIARLNAWIDAHAKDDRMPTALNERCWARAVANTELDLAIADCNGAIKKGTKDSQFLDSRAFAYLRNGDYDKSIADYQAVLKLQPRKALSMYGLGLAKIGKGQTESGKKDIDAAKAIQPGVDGFYSSLGLKP